MPAYSVNFHLSLQVIATQQNTQTTSSARLSLRTPWAAAAVHWWTPGCVRAAVCSRVGWTQTPTRPGHALRSTLLTGTPFTSSLSRWATRFSSVAAPVDAAPGSIGAHGLTVGGAGALGADFVVTGGRGTPAPERRCAGLVGFIPRACRELGPHPQEPSGWGLAVHPVGQHLTLLSPVPQVLLFLQVTVESS